MKRCDSLRQRINAKILSTWFPDYLSPRHAFAGLIQMFVALLHEMQTFNKNGSATLKAITKLSHFFLFDPTPTPYTRCTEILFKYLSSTQKLWGRVLPPRISSFLQQARKKFDQQNSMHATSDKIEIFTTYDKSNACKCCRQ